MLCRRTFHYRSGSEGFAPRVARLDIRMHDSRRSFHPLLGGSACGCKLSRLRGPQTPRHHGTFGR